MFDLPDDSEEDVMRIYNSGRTHFSELDWDTYYEINCFSAAQKLPPAHSFAYGQCTLHISADKDTLNHLVRHLFSVTLDEIDRKMHR
jgi:hypothetical protein